MNAAVGSVYGVYRMLFSPTYKCRFLHQDRLAEVEVGNLAAIYGVPMTADD